MRNLSRVLAVGALAASVGTSSANAAAPRVVEVRYNPWVVCVTEPCPQPFPVTVCVLPDSADLRTCFFE